jgi:hypothetical protein
MDRHIERPITNVDWQSCGKCGGIYPCHGSYVMHECVPEAPYVGAVTPIPTRLEAVWAPPVLPPRFYNLNDGVSVAFAAGRDR